MSSVARRPITVKMDEVGRVGQFTDRSGRLSNSRKRNTFILSTIEDHNMIDSRSEVEFWDSIVVEAAFSHHVLHSITDNSQ